MPCSTSRSWRIGSWSRFAGDTRIWPSGHGWRCTVAAKIPMWKRSRLARPQVRATPLGHEAASRPRLHSAYQTSQAERTGASVGADHCANLGEGDLKFRLQGPESVAQLARRPFGAEM